MITKAPVMSLARAYLQSASGKFEVRPKRLRGKNVSWPSEDKLCQVRLFVAEDSPSISGMIHQESYQAKQTRFMHAVIPVPLDDLPPGFEGSAVNRAMFNMEATSAIVSQISWHCPPEYVLDPSWQVVSGKESTELGTQRERELRVLEAVYPRTSAIPPSPIEPVETCIDVGGANITNIPLVPIEDDEEEMEVENFRAGNLFHSEIVDRQDSSNSPTLSPSESEEDSDKVCSDGVPVKCTVDQPLGASLLKDADLNVAAAAAAAYAAVRATESGRIIDHDLLIQILSNPVLLKTLSKASQKHKYPVVESITHTSNRIMCNSNIIKTNGNQSADGLSEPQSTIPATLTTLDESQKLAAPDAQILKVSNGMGEVGQVNEPFTWTPQPFSQPLVSQPLALPTSRPLMPRQDYLKELIQQHGMLNDNNGPRTFVAQNENNPSLPRNIAVAPRLEPLHSWPGFYQTRPVTLPLFNSRNDNGSEMAHARHLRPCFYFNTLRGCRNGANCAFLHESAIDKNLERVCVDAYQQVKRPRVGFSARDTSAEI